MALMKCLGTVNFDEENVYRLPTPTHKLLVYGGGGVGKSTFAALTAKALWEDYGKKTRLISADGGGAEPYRALIEAGIVEYWPIDTWKGTSIFNLLDQAVNGAWPVDVQQADSEIKPGITIFRQCPKCKKSCSTSLYAQPKECISCKAVLTERTKTIRIVDENLKKVGAIIFEGCTSFGSLLLETLRHLDAAGGRVLALGDYMVKGAGKQHYGDAQSYIQQFVGQSGNLPIPIVMWTALEMRGVDDDGRPAYGPKLPGKALLELCIPWFNSVLHLDQEGDARYVYLQPHPADTKPFIFKAKISASAPGTPAKLVYDPKKNTAREFFTLLEDLKQKARADLKI